MTTPGKQTRVHRRRGSRHAANVGFPVVVCWPRSRQRIVRVVRDFEARLSVRKNPNGVFDRIAPVGSRARQPAGIIAREDCGINRSVKIGRRGTGDAFRGNPGFAAAT